MSNERWVLDPVSGGVKVAEAEELAAACGGPGIAAAPNARRLEGIFAISCTVVALIDVICYRLLMRYEEFVDRLGKLKLFETALVLPFYNSAPQAQRQLSDWKQAGKLLQLRRGIYAFPPPYEKGERPHTYTVANRLVTPSYVSLHTALSFYDLIPEHVASITSVTSGRPVTLKNHFGRFMYRHVKPDMFFGFRYLALTDTQSVFLATAEKALLDLIYLTPHADDEAYLRELRLQNLDLVDTDLLIRFAQCARSPKLQRAVDFILELIDEELATYVTL